MTPKSKTYQNHVQACDYIFHSAIHPENIKKFIGNVKLTFSDNETTIFGSSNTRIYPLQHSKQFVTEVLKQHYMEIMTTKLR